MNFYNPYMFYPYSTLSMPVSSGILNNGIGKGSFSFSSLLNGAQKTLNFVNQAIPVVKQVSPMMKNAKTMFRVMNEFKKIETPQTVNNVKKRHPQSAVEPINEKNNYPISSSGPTFFI